MWLCSAHLHIHQLNLCCTPSSLSSHTLSEAQRSAASQQLQRGFNWTSTVKKKKHLNSSEVWMCLAKQLRQLMTCKCCCASSDSRKLQCNFLNSATTIREPYIGYNVKENLNKNIYLYYGYVQCLG